jgi:hypothetical protein
VSEFFFAPEAEKITGYSVRGGASNGLSTRHITSGFGNFIQPASVPIWVGAIHAESPFRKRMKTTPDDPCIPIKVVLLGEALSQTFENTSSGEHRLLCFLGL